MQVPTAELRPDEEGEEAQSDEKDMGMSYEELGDLGYCRKVCAQLPGRAMLSWWASGRALRPSVHIHQAEGKMGT